MRGGQGRRESREEVRIQKPNKRMMGLLHWHQLGWADDADLAKLLGEEETARRRRAAKKKV
ncbi:MAG: hypothetical protein ABI162_13495 [Luteolibacter sp.]